MSYKITLLKGDGIGPEIVNEAVKVMNKTAQLYGFEIEYKDALIGGIAIDTYNNPLPAQTVEMCKSSDAVLLGAVGGHKWEGLPANMLPEAGLLGIRKELGIYANLRPARIFEPLRNASPLKNEIIGDALDILIVRELTGGIYFGKRGRFDDNGLEAAYDTECYNTDEIRRIVIKGFEAAMSRRKVLCSVDKANVLESSRLWRQTVLEVAKDYPEVELHHLYVDNCAMQLVVNPKQFDVIVTSNIFGDILSDEASVISGSIGMLASASLGSANPGLYEPIHGSAPDIAGQNKANPLATILSAAMLFKYSLGENAAADAIEKAVAQALDDGLRTSDIYSEGTTLLNTQQMGDAVCERIR